MENNITASPKTRQNRKAKIQWQKDSQWDSVCRDNRMQVDWDATNVWPRVNCAPQAAGLTATWRMEEDPLCCSQISPQIRQDTAAEDISRLLVNSCQKRGDMIGYGGFNRISGTNTRCRGIKRTTSLSSGWSCKQSRLTRFVDVMDDLTISGWEIYQKNCAVPCRQGFMVQNSSGDTCPKEESLTAYLTETTAGHNSIMMAIQNMAATTRHAMLWGGSLHGWRMDSEG